MFELPPLPPVETSKENVELSVTNSDEIERDTINFSFKDFSYEYISPESVHIDNGSTLYDLRRSYAVLLEGKISELSTAISDIEKVISASSPEIVNLSENDTYRELLQLKTSLEKEHDNLEKIIATSIEKNETFLTMTEIKEDIKKKIMSDAFRDNLVTEFSNETGAQFMPKSVLMERAKERQLLIIQRLDTCELFTNNGSGSESVVSSGNLLIDCFDDEEAIRHEFWHNSHGGFLEYIPFEKIKKCLNLRPFEEGKMDFFLEKFDQIFLDELGNRSLPQKNDTYYFQPTEVLVRKKSFERFLESKQDVFNWKYGDDFTEEIYNNFLEFLKNCTSKEAKNVPKDVIEFFLMVKDLKSCMYLMNKVAATDGDNENLVYELSGDGKTATIFGGIKGV